MFLIWNAVISVTLINSVGTAAISWSISKIKNWLKNYDIYVNENFKVFIVKAELKNYISAFSIGPWKMGRLIFVIII